MNATHLTERDDLLNINEASRRLPGRPHRATLWRWAREGIQTPNGRVRLHVVRLGRRVFVAPEDIDQFARALTDADAGKFTAPLSTASAKNSVPRPSSRAADAEREAVALGI